MNAVPALYNWGAEQTTECWRIGGGADGTAQQSFFNPEEDEEGSQSRDDVIQKIMSECPSR